MSLRLLLIEDCDIEVQVWQDTVEALRAEQNEEIILCSVKAVRCAVEKLESIDYDGIIVDLHLGDDEANGSTFIEILQSKLLRIPTIVVSGTPNELSDELRARCLAVKDRSAVDQRIEIDRFRRMRNVGLSSIIGGRGRIETKLTDVFQSAILPQIDSWLSYGSEENEIAERALLRHVLLHLIQALDDENSQELTYFMEEFYLLIPDSNGRRPGSLMMRRSDDVAVIVLNPACDLEVRGEGCKAKTLLVAEVDSFLSTVGPLPPGLLSKTKKKEIKQFLNNNKGSGQHLHWMPPSLKHEGGFINFAKLSTYDEDEIDDKLSYLEIRVAPPFLKDIVARFSSFYARQGQPKLESEDYLTSIEIPVNHGASNS